MELVIGPTRQLIHFLASCHRCVAEGALTSVLLHVEDDGLAKTTLDSLGHGLVGGGRGIVGHLAD